MMFKSWKNCLDRVIATEVVTFEVTLVLELKTWLIWGMVVTFLLHLPDS